MSFFNKNKKDELAFTAGKNYAEIVAKNPEKYENSLGLPPAIYAEFISPEAVAYRENQNQKFGYRS